MPTVTLRKMTAGEYDAWRVHSTAGYAAANVRAGNWDAADAQARSEAAFKNLLPQGVETPNHHIFSVLAGADVVGHVWIWMNGRTPPRAFVYDLELRPAFRGKGLGKATMRAAEAQAKTFGATRIGLHVFAYNANAHALYKALGYEYVSHSMEKPL